MSCWPDIAVYSYHDGRKLLPLDITIKPVHGLRQTCQVVVRKLVAVFLRLNVAAESTDKI